MEGYAGQQYIGIDLHRRRSVIVRTTNTGEMLEAVQITNSPLAPGLAAASGQGGAHGRVGVAVAAADLITSRSVAAGRRTRPHRRGSREFRSRAAPGRRAPPC